MMDLPWMDRRTASLSGNVKKNWAGSGTAVGGDAPDVLMPPPPVVPQATAGATNQQKESVQVKLELGHKAVFRKNPTPDGFTHDWTMFVRGPEGSNIQHFVDRVVFHLHDSFPKPRRIVKDPPYQIKESGYAGFNLPIEIYFKNKEDPKKILFHYDLFLHVDGCPPVNHVRCEKLTFQNPSEEFRRKLIKAGGVGNLGTSEHTPQQTPTATTPPSTIQVTTPESKTYADLFEAPLKSDSGQKKSKSHSSLKDRTSSRGKPGSSSYLSGMGSTTPPALTPPPSAPQKSPPTTPTKEPRAPLGTPTKSKEKVSKRSAEAALSADLSKKKRKDLPSIVVEDVMKVREREERKEREKERQREKEKEREKEQEKEKERVEWEKEKKKDRRSTGSKDSKSKHRSSRKEVGRSKSDSSEPKETISDSPPSRPFYAPPTRVSEGKVMPEKPAPTQDIPMLDDDESIGEISDAFDDESVDMDVQIPDFSDRVSSPASTLSFSSVKGTSAGGSGPLSALLAEMEDDEDLLSPLSTKSPAPHFSPPSLTQVIQESVRILGKSPETQSNVSAKASMKEPSPPPPQLKPTSGGKAKRKDKELRKSKSEKRTKEQRNQSKISKESCKENKETKVINDNSQKDPMAKDVFREYSDSKAKDSTVEIHTEAINKDTSRDLVERDLNNPTAPNGESLNVLLELQRRLMSMTDRDLLQQVVNVIEETGMYKISDATFDFDLCCLDITTVKKLQVCLEMTC